MSQHQFLFTEEVQQTISAGTSPPPLAEFGSLSYLDPLPPQFANILQLHSAESLEATPILVGGSPLCFVAVPLSLLAPCSNLALRVNNQTTCVL